MLLIFYLSLKTYSKPSWPHLCCWRCHSQSPALRLTLWLCWRPVQRKGWVAGSGPRAQAVLVLEEQMKWRILTIHHILRFTSFPPIERGLPSSWRRYWFPPRSLASDQASPSSLSQNSTTLFLSSCTQVPSELTTWYTNNTLYPYSHTLEHLSLAHSTSARSVNPHLSEKQSQPFSISTSVHPCYHCTDKTMTQTLLQ